MRMLSLPLSILAVVVLSAGCADTRTSTAEMGASPSTPRVLLYCRDGAYVRTPGGCGSHGGTERDMSAAQ